jgi:hypothetical protein
LLAGDFLGSSLAQIEEGLRKLNMNEEVRPTQHDSDAKNTS